MAALLALGCDDGTDQTPTEVDASTEIVEPDAGTELPDQGQPDADLTMDAGQDPADAAVIEVGDVVCKEGQDPRPSNWGLESHCKGQSADYERLFDDTRVHRIDLTITPEVHAAAMADLTDILGEPGERRQPGGFADQNPMWFEAQVEYDGLLWTHVGMRYKGNSSLQSVWSSNGKKLSFRFNFDKFEDAHPEIDNQRFFGFKKMTFSNGFKDDSLIRDKLAADTFRAGGVPAAQSSFVRIYADLGEGPVYFGLYTMIEDPSDEMIEAQFEDDSGNLYKPDGDSATWTSMDPEDFVKESNEDEADWSDIEAAVAALNASRQDAAAWRETFEAHVDVDAFLLYLAINQTMVNWDSYGSMTHNYYIYANPADEGRIVWFPWDLNESFMSGGRGGNSSEVMLDSVGAQWPLIRNLLDDPVYRVRYVEYLELVLQDVFGAELDAQAERYHALIAPYVNGEIEAEAAPYSNLSNAASFTTALSSARSGLLTHIAGRRQAVRDAIDSE
jgi:spore coat protein CotH